MRVTDACDTPRGQYRLREDTVHGGVDYVVEWCFDPDRDIWWEEYRDLWEERARAVLEALVAFERAHGRSTPDSDG